jgi:hypothetical protein
VPPRSTASGSTSPGRARIACTTASQLTTGAPAALRHPVVVRRPARSAAPPATTRPNHRIERRPVQPQADALQRIALDSSEGSAQVEHDASRCRRARPRPRSAALSSAVRPAARASAGPARSRSALLDRAHGVAGGKARRMRRRAAPAGARAPAGSGIPCMYRPAYTAIANRKLNSGRPPR